MEGRMTVCNMSIEAGAQAGLVAPDDTTFAYLEGRPARADRHGMGAALDDWRSLVTDAGAAFDKEVVIDAATLRPQVVWGTNPSQIVTIDDTVPDPDELADEAARESAKRALAYMGLKAGHADPRHRRRHRVHRIVHELAHRGPPRRGRRSPRVAR